MQFPFRHDQVLDIILCHPTQVIMVCEMHPMGSCVRELGPQSMSLAENVGGRVSLVEESR